MSFIINPFVFSAGGDPSDIADLNRWYKADEGVYEDAGTDLAENGDAVQQWNDFSGNASHATQGTAGSRPIYTTGGQNGKPYLRFDGSKSLPWDGTGIVSVMFTIFIVGLHDTGQFGWFTDGSSGTNHQNLQIGQSSTTIFRFGTFGSQIDYTHAPGSLNIWCLQLQGVADDKVVFKNGVEVDRGSGATPNLSANPGQQFGGNAANFEGDMYEFIVYARELTGTEIDDVFTYLNDKYAIY